jgi:hypothetical protein
MDRRTGENQRQVISDENTTRGHKGEEKDEKNEGKARADELRKTVQIFGIFSDD